MNTAINILLVCNTRERENITSAYIFLNKFFINLIKYNNGNIIMEKMREERKNLI